MIMEMRTLGSSGLQVSRIGFGVLTMGATQLDLDLDAGADLIRYALDQGINFFDTAQYYRTYPYLKRALAGRQDQVVLCSKCLSGSYEAMREAVEEARTQLDRDVIEIFLLHEVRHNGDLESRTGALTYLLEAKAKGLIKAVGVSTHHADVAMAAAVRPEFDVFFPLINFQGLGIRYGDGPGTREQMEQSIQAAAESGKGVFAMKVFGGGNLTGHYREALDYVCALPGIHSLIIGFGQHQEIDEILAYEAGTLSPDFHPQLNHKKMRIDQGDCEGCGACLLRCPNGAIAWTEHGTARIDQSVCLNCGYCAPHCPVRAIIML